MSRSLLVEDALARGQEDLGLELVTSAPLGTGIAGQWGHLPAGRSLTRGAERGVPGAIHLGSPSGAGWGRSCWLCGAGGAGGTTERLKSLWSHATSFLCCLPVKREQLQLLISPALTGSLAPAWPSPGDPPHHV